MGRGNRLLLIVVAVLLSPATVAHASVYSISSVPGDSGTISGSISGTGTDVSSFYITVASSFGPFTFDSAVAGSSGGLYSQGAFTASGTPVNYFDFSDSQGDSLFFDVTGDFTSGLDATPQNFYSSGIFLGETGVINLTNNDGDGPEIGSLTLTVATPEPSSWILLLSGVIGLGILGVEHRRLRDLPAGQAPDLLAV